MEYTILHKRLFSLNNYLMISLIMFFAIAVFQILSKGITVNQGLAIAFTFIIIIIWNYNKVNGIIAGLIFFFIKASFVRIAFMLDATLGLANNFDLLAITPALLLSGLIVWHLYFMIASGEKIFSDPVSITLGIFCFLNFASIFFPTNSIILGLSGFERNIIPNTMIFFLTISLFKNYYNIYKLLKVILIFGCITTLYGLGQYAIGIYPWEMDWMTTVGFQETTRGWLTIGLRGVEFRVYSMFYGYMDFTFVNSIIFAMIFACRNLYNKKWQSIRYIYICLWIMILLVSLERMPIVMTAVSAFIVVYLNSSQRKRKIISWFTIISFLVVFSGLNIASPYLKSTGADKLMRLAELANPLSAVSVEERIESKWIPTINIIKSNPIGVGIGYGSQTKASKDSFDSEYWAGPHNELLQKTLEVGIVGGIVYLTLLILVFKDSKKVAQRKDDLKTFGYGFIAVTISFWICGIVNLPFSGSSGLLYWSIAGVVSSLKITNMKRIDQEN